MVQGLHTEGGGHVWKFPYIIETLFIIYMERLRRRSSRQTPSEMWWSSTAILLIVSLLLPVQGFMAPTALSAPHAFIAPTFQRHALMRPVLGYQATRRATAPTASNPLGNAGTEELPGSPQEANAADARYSTYDEIRKTLTASRRRSYEQGRQGCCGKAADHLGVQKPPPGSPWARDAK